MTTDGVQAPRPRGESTGWGWLAAATLARVYLLFVLALVGCALLPMFLGLTGSVVQSGSMEPHIRPGDVVLAMVLPKDEAAPMGRVITFPSPAGSAKSGTMLHRLVAVNQDGSLVTAGDANAQVDSTPLDRVDIIARACILVPWIGLPALWITHGSFLWLAIWLVLTIAAVAIEFTQILSTPRRRHRLQPPRTPRHPDAGDRPAAKPRAGRLPKPVVGPLVVVVAIVVGSAVIVAPTYGQTEALFSGRTTSVGNSWAMSAAATAVKLAFSTSPSGSTGGVSFATQPVVAIQDASGHTTAVPGAVALEITTPAGATLACAANPVDAISGVARFSGCAIDKVGTYTLTARSGALTAAVSSSIVVARGPASQLRFTTSPSVTTAFNTAFAAQPVVTVQDAGGNTITTSTAATTLSLTTPAGATLACTTNPKAAVSGVATFSGCKVNQPGSYTLTATSGALSSGVSASFTVVSGPATKVVFTSSPSSSVSATAFATQPVVTVQDASGNTVTTSTAAVTLALTTPGGATLTCTTNPNSASSGVAAFSGCKVDKTGTYTLRASTGSLTTATSASFTIASGPATKLVFTSSPSSSVSATTFATQPVVTVQDASGNTVTTSTAAVTLSLTTPGGATLTCTTNPKAAVSGVAAFSGCKVDKAGTYTVTAMFGTMTAGISTAFTITPGTATRLVFTTSPSDTASDTAFAVQPVVAAVDASGNTVTSYNSTIALFVTGLPGGVTLACAANPKNPVSGIATFADCKINRRGTYTLSAFSGLLGTSDSFAIGGG